MSLHLIESTKLPARSTRKRFGVTASVLVHATLVAGAFTAASAAPVVKETRVDTAIVYVAPTAPNAPARTAAHSSNQASRATTSAPQLSLPIMPDLITIPVEIPPIAPDRTYVFEISSARDFARRSSGAGTGIGDEPGSGTAPAGGVMSDLQVDRQVSILSGYRTPRYPEALRAAGVEETLNASFVVDTLGRVESGSLEIPDAMHAPFAGAVREALANARFRPAESQGRRVRQRVVQAFVFSLRRE
ncbi:MAG: TonB family protein [Gemmatimonadaceae bacterium]